MRLGEYDFEQPDETKFSDFNVTEIKRHPLFDDPTHRFDVALLKLDGAAQYSDYIRPVCLPKADTDIRTNETVIVAGRVSLNSISCFRLFVKLKKLNGVRDLLCRLG